MKYHRLKPIAASVAVLISLSAVATVFACNIPVFRYALENWQPDPYQVLIVSHGPLDEPQASWLEKLRRASTDEEQPANLDVYHLNLAERSFRDLLQADFRQRQAPAWAVEQLEKLISDTSPDQTRMIVLYPEVWDRVAWDIPLTEDSVEQLIDSPLRQEIARRLLDGQSAVWVLIEGGEKTSDDAAWETLERELVRSQSVVKLPAKELIETDDEYRAEVDIELRVDFSAVRLAADDPREQAFAALLRGSESDLREFDGPIAIPIYGRGRTYFGLVGEGIQARTIEDNGHFLCGACSCQVKRENPGIDMLMAVNWNGHIQGSAMPEVVLPELTGIGALEMVAVPSSRAESEEPQAQDQSTSAPSPDAGMAQAASDQVANADVPARTRVADAPAPPVAADTQKTTPSGEAVSSASEPLPDRFSQRLMLGVAGGLCVAVTIMALATLWLRRAV